MRIFEVRLHERPIGTLRESNGGFIQFQLDASYLQMRSRPVLGQTFTDTGDRPFRGKKRNKLPPFFANLVPEGELRPFLESHLAVEGGDDLGLLEKVSHDLPGAVELRRLSGIEDEGPDWEDAVAPRELGPTGEELRFSLAGVQLKFSVVRAANKVTFPVKGTRGRYIAKLDSSRFPHLVENEYTCLEWARLAGFEVPECQIVETTQMEGSLLRYSQPGVHLLLIKRYDRDGALRIHQEDFAQVVNTPPGQKYGNVSYEKLGKLVDEVVGPEGLEDFIRRLVLMVACGNADAHLKNWSLVYPDRVNARLAPVYDFVSTIAWPEIDSKLALRLGGRKLFGLVSQQTFSHLATAVGKDPKQIEKLVRGTLESLASAWLELQRAGRCRMVESHRNELARHWQETPLLEEPFRELARETR